MTVSGNVTPILQRAKEAKLASRQLSALSGEQRNKILSSIAKRYSTHEAEILAANQKDLKQAKVLQEKGLLTDALTNRLKLDREKLAGVIQGIEQIASMEDPLGKVLLARELDHDLTLYKVTSHIGVIAVVFESRPDALPQIAALCLKTANAIILKGGSEAEHSNRVLFEYLKEAAVEAGVPADAIQLLESRSDFTQLLQATQYVDLVIPRGSGQLVRDIQSATHIPVLGHAEGICHVYVDEEADLAMALRIAVDAKAQYPAACNAAETLLVHRTVAGTFLPQVVAALTEQGVEVRCDEQSKALLPNAKVVEAIEADWCTEYSDLILSIKIVDSVGEAIDHINFYGSGHTDAIVTENHTNAERFFSEVNSAGVFLNASTRFADGFRYGFGAEVGISTGKLHPRGPVGIEGLVTYKYKLVGNGQIVADYSGPNSKRFTHKDLGRSQC